MYNSVIVGPSEPIFKYLPVFSGKEVKNVSTNQRQRWPCWILNHSKKQQHFLRTSRGTFLAHLLTSHAVVLETQTHPLIMAIPRFIQLVVPLPSLKPMDQSRRGVVRILEAQAHPLIMAIPRFIQLIVPLPPLKPMDQ
jgi:hypothetical protein